MIENIFWEHIPQLALAHVTISVFIIILFLLYILFFTIIYLFNYVYTTFQ